MLENYLIHINWLGFAMAAAAYWVIGSLWYSVLFGKAWTAELAKNNISIGQPDGKEVGGKMIGTFMYSAVAVFALNYLVWISGSVNLQAGLKLGAFAGLCIGFTPMAVAYLWVNRSFKLLLIDGMYHVAGMTAAGALLAWWR